MQQSLQRGEDATQIVADSGEDDVCSVTLTAFEMATTEVTVGLHVADSQDRADFRVGSN